MFLCKIGCHNYEQVDCKIESEIKSLVLNLGITQSGFTNAYAKKVCLNCGKIIDEIMPEINKLKENIAKSKDRQRIAALKIKENTASPPATTPI